jgi:hypothetical protein
MARLHSITKMIQRTGLAPWVFEFPSQVALYIYFLIEASFPPARALQRYRGTAVELGRNHSKCSKDFSLKDTAIIWPRLYCTCHIHSKAVTLPPNPVGGRFFETILGPSEFQ